MLGTTRLMAFDNKIREVGPSSFAYPSKLDAREIRLLKPVRISKTKLDFDLVVTQRPSQDAEPRYIAISYTWGKENAADVIYLDKKPFRVRSNLWTCLYCICESQERREGQDLIWVDAICINQADDAEKNSQVRMMSRTYSDAMCVYAWLGLPQGTTEGFGHAVSSGLPTKHAEIAQLPGEEHASIIQELYHRCKTWLGRDPINGLQVPLTVEGATWEREIGDLTNRDYWQRRWVVQEFLLARNLYIFCGKASIPWHEFRILAHRHEMSLAADRGLSDKSSHNAAIPLLDGKAFRKKPWRSTLRHLLQQYSKMDCGDPRDRVFSLLSLASDVDYLQDVRPNYALTMDKVAVHILAYRMRIGYEQPGLIQDMDADMSDSDMDWTTAAFSELGYDSISQRHCRFLLDEAKKEFVCQRAQGGKTIEYCYT